MWIDNKGKESVTPVLFSYNGYSNRETWATVLHLSNESLELLQAAQKATDIKEFTHRVANSRRAMRQDIGDLSAVNWTEVAAAVKS